MTDPGPEICAAVADARQKLDRHRQNRAVKELQTHVEPQTRWAGRATRDEADLHDAAADSLLLSIDGYDCERGKAFRSLYSKILSRRLTSLARKQTAQCRGGGSVANLSQLLPRHAGSVCELDLKNRFGEGSAQQDLTALVDRAIDCKEFAARLAEKLTPFQNRVLDLYLDNLTYREIASREACDIKKVDNTLAMVKAQLPALAIEPIQK